jgi:hypothetical protein
MLKKNTILILLLGTLLGLSSCGVTPGPRYFNGNYYWIDSNCVGVRPLTATSIECRNSDKEETGYRNAMTNQEMQAYKYQQQRKRELRQAIKQFSDGLTQFGEEQRRRNNTNAYRYKPPTLSYGSNTSSGYRSSFGNTYEYDLSNPSDRVRYRADPKARLRDRLNVNPQRRIERNIGQYGGGALNKNRGSQW